jgi:hemoglobin
VLVLASLLLGSALLAEPPSNPVPSDQQGAVNWEREFGVVRKPRDPVTGEIPLDPYPQSNANAGALPFRGEGMAHSFGGKDGIRHITDRTIELSLADPRIKAIFVEHDLVRLRRTLFEQVCFILNAGCPYSGRDMKTAHKGLGTTRADLNALVENLQSAMREAHVPFAAQNRLLAKLAPMDRAVTER